eukprot:m.105799 g.105799  ORF g.105799 m.105799 type:complete len:194 (+) comp27676_c0_seq4:276-857(+)
MLMPVQQKNNPNIYTDRFYSLDHTGTVTQNLSPMSFDKQHQTIDMISKMLQNGEINSVQASRQTLRSSHEDMSDKIEIVDIRTTPTGGHMYSYKVKDTGVNGIVVARSKHNRTPTQTTRVAATEEFPVSSSYSRGVASKPPVLAQNSLSPKLNNQMLQYPSPMLQYPSPTDSYNSMDHESVEQQMLRGMTIRK